MADLFAEIKKIVHMILGNYGLTDLKYGQVVSANPLKIKISDRITLERDQLHMTSAVGELNIKDEVLLLRVQRGMKHIVLSKVVD